MVSFRTSRNSTRKLACLLLPLLAAVQPPSARVIAAPASPSSAPSSVSAAKPSSPAPATANTAKAFSADLCVVPSRTVGILRRTAYRAPRSATELGANLQCLLQGSVRGGRWGIMAVSLSRGDTLFALDEDANLRPASTLKLFTAALVLDQLGYDHRFRTAVLRTGDIDSTGKLHGNLILQGGGDPAFTTGSLNSTDLAPMDLLAELVRGSGIRSVTGSLIADPSAFDGVLVPDGWLNRYLSAPYAARVSALSLNSNVASVVIAPGESETSVVLDPPAETMTLRNSVRTVAGSRGASISVRQVDDYTLQASGWIGTNASPRRVPVVVEDPASFAAGAFRSALAAHGVNIGGSTMVSGAPVGARHLVDVPSPPVAQLVTMMNRESINHYAELLFKNAGRGLDGLQSGSADAGFLKLADFLYAKVGTDPGSVYAVDGSGLSPMNRVTARAQVQLLSHAHESTWGPIFHASLPVAGESGTLRDRMLRTTAQGNLHAKTGTTADVVALSGYVTAENGEIMAFSFLYNGPDKDRARGIIDLLGPALAELARK